MKEVLSAKDARSDYLSHALEKFFEPELIVGFVGQPLCARTRSYCYHQSWQANYQYKRPSLGL